jgi:hypothetical protein
VNRIPPFRKAVVAFLATREASLLEEWTESDWAKQLQWLDRSGLALPVAEKLLESENGPQIPPSILCALTKRLCDNQDRMIAMLELFDEIQRKLKAGRIRFCCLKGFSLITDCYSSIRERHQVDFDLLIDANNANSAAAILATLDYKLISANDSGEMRFARPWTRHLTANSWMYDISEGPAVELHTRLWEPETELVDFAIPEGWNESICTSAVHGLTIPRLAPAWQFVHLLLHVFRHLLDSWVRLLSIYEIAVYLDREHENYQLWQEVCTLAVSDAELASACVLVLCMVRAAFPGQLPGPLNALCESYLSVDSAIWVRHFTEQWLFADPPGTKLTLLVQRQFCEDSAKWRSYMLQRLLPLRAPHSLSQDASPTVKKNVRYKSDELRYKLSRLGYHLASGYGYLRSAARWRHLSQSYNKRTMQQFQ